MMRKERHAARIVIAGAILGIVSAVPGCGSSEVGTVKVAAPKATPPPGANMDPTKPQTIVKNSPNSLQNARNIKNRPVQ